MIIALDGPAGAGKSTIAKGVAESLGFQLIDTGAIYRTVAHKALGAGLALEDGAACAALALGLDFRFAMNQGKNEIRCGEALLGDEIRTQEVGLGASQVSAHPEVRAALLDLQRRLGRERDSVLEGRDIGTVVFPDAELKIFLTASPEERAQRRVAQLALQGVSEDYEAVLQEIRERDHRDSSRAVAPLKQADDAIAVDTTGRPVEEIIAQIVSLARARQ